MTPDPDARRRALEQILVNGIGAPPEVRLQPVDLARLAPGRLEQPQEGLVTAEVDDPEARLRAQADEAVRFANLGEVSSRAIEGLTGARGADIWTPMRQRADEPLKAFLALQQKKGRPGMTPAQAQANVRALHPDAPAELVSTVTPDNYDAVVTTLRARAGEAERRERATQQEEALKARLLQQKEEGKLTRDVQWARIRQDADQAGASLEFRKWLAEQELAAKEDKRTEGQTLPAGEATSIGQSRAALRALDTLEQQFTAKGTGGLGAKIAARLPWESDPVQYEDDVRAAAQAVGTVLEGGKLAAGDEVKYRNLFPKAGDSLERGRNKLANVRRLVSDLTESKVEALGGAGYNVEGLRTKPQPGPTRVPPSRGLPTGPDGKPTLDTAGGSTVRVRINGTPLDIPRANVEAARKRAAEKGHTFEVIDG